VTQLEFLNALIMQKLPLGIIKKLFIFDKAGRKVDFSEQLQINGTNRLIDYGTIETVIEGDFNHFYNKSGDIQVRNNDRFFNLPFPNTLKDNVGTAAEFLQDPHGIINVFKKPGYNSGTYSNSRYTLVEIGADLELNGKQFSVKFATLVLTKVVTDTKEVALIKTDGLIRIAMDTSAENVVDGLKRWYIQRPISFLITEILKKAYGVVAADGLTVNLPPGFVVPKFIDTLLDFSPSVNGMFGRPPVQLDTNADGEPDSFPMTSKLCRAMCYDVVNNYLFLGIDDEIWQLDLDTFLFTLKKTITTNEFSDKLFIERLSLETIGSYNYIRVQARYYVHEVLALEYSPFADDVLKEHLIYISYIDRADWISDFDQRDYVYDSEFNFFPITGVLNYTMEVSNGNYYKDAVSFAYMAGMCPFQSGPLLPILQADPVHTQWSTARDTDQYAFLSLENLEFKKMIWPGGWGTAEIIFPWHLVRIRDESGLHQTADYDANIDPISLPSFESTIQPPTFKTLNIPIPFPQTIWFSYPGLVNTYHSKLSHTVAMMRSPTFKGEIGTTDDFISSGTNNTKKPDFSMGRGYYALYGQMHTIDYNDRYNMNGGLENVYFASSANKYRHIRDIKFSLGQKGVNCCIDSSDGKRLEIYAIPSPVKIGLMYVQNYVKEGIKDNTVWYVGAKSNFDTSYTYRYAGLTVREMTLGGQGQVTALSEIYNLRMFVKYGREVQPLCLVKGPNETFLLFGITFQTLDGLRFIGNNANSEDRKFGTDKYAECVVYEINPRSDVNTVVLITDIAYNDKTVGGSYHGVESGGFTISGDSSSAFPGGTHNYLIKVTNSSGHKYCFQPTAPTSLPPTTTLEYRATYAIEGTPIDYWKASPTDSTSLLDVLDCIDDGQTSDDANYIYYGNTNINTDWQKGTQDLNLQFESTTQNLTGLKVHIRWKADNGGFEFDWKLINVGTSTEIAHASVFDCTSTTWTNTLIEVNTTIASGTTIKIELDFFRSSSETNSRVMISNVVIETLGAVVQDINYSGYQQRLDNSIDSVNPENNVLPAGNFRNTYIRKMAKILSSFMDVAVLEGVYVDGYYYVAVLMLNNITDYGVDTVYTDSPNQYAIWKLSSYSWPSRVCVKTLFNQPKNLIVSGLKIFFSLEGLGIFASIDTDDSDAYREYDAINPGVFDEMYTNGQTAVVSNATNPNVYAVSSPNGGERYSYKLLEGKYYLWQLGTRYIPIIEFADFSGMSCEDVLQEFCSIINWTKGFDENGNFFMVRRNPDYSDTPDLTLLEGYDTKYIDITEMENTVDEIINQCSVTPFRANRQDIKFNIIYRKRLDDRVFPDMTFDAEQRDIYQKKINLICVRDGEISLASANIDTCPLFKWKVVEVETEVRIIKDLGGSDTTVQLASVFGGSATSAGIRINDWFKIQNPATDEYVFKRINAVSVPNNTIGIESSLGFAVTKDTVAIILRDKNYYYSNDYVATGDWDVDRIYVNSLDNLGIGNIVENVAGVRAIVTHKGIEASVDYWATGSFGTPYIKIDKTEAEFALTNAALKAYWSPLLSNTLYEVGGNSVFIKLTLKETSDTVDTTQVRTTRTTADTRRFYTGDYIEVDCPGLKLEADEASRQIYIDSVSVALYGLVSEEITDKKFLTRPLARNLAKLRVTENAKPRFKGMVQSILLPQLSAVVKDNPDSPDGRLFVVRVQNSKLFPLIQGNSVDFYVTSIKHNLRKRTTEFGVKGIKAIGES